MRAAAAVLLALALALPLAFLPKKSVTLDEVAHIGAGYSYLRTGEVVLNPMHPPLVKEIAALPLLLLDPPMPADAATIRDLGRDLTYQWEFGSRLLSGPDFHRIVIAARLPVVFLSLALAGLIFVWARALWGPAGGLAALFLYVFDPTIVAHAQLVTTDVGFAFFAASFVYLLRRFASAPSLANAAFAGVALGLAFGAKFSAVALPPIAAVLLFVARRATRPPATRDLLVGFLAMTAIGAIVTWAIYLFPADPTFYARGLGKVQADYDPRYLRFFLGDFDPGRWPHYFLVAWLVKTPLPAILAVLVAVAIFLGGRRAGVLEEAFVAVPALVLFAGYSLGAAPLGIRYVIPCYPFLFVYAGRIGPWLASLGRRGAAMAAVLALWTVTEFAAIAPDHLPYFNQIAGGPRGGLAWLDDSNVDWGQGLIQLREYLDEHRVERFRFCGNTGVDRARYGVGGEKIDVEHLLAPPGPGVLVLSGHCVARALAWGKWRHGDGAASWLATTEPTAVVGHTYYVYRIP